MLTPAKENISSTQTTTSDSCQNISGRQRGSASTASGRSQSEYCGDHTLFVSRKAAITRKASWANRGRRRTESPNQPIARQAMANRPSERALTKVGESAPGTLSQIRDLVSVA